MQRIVTIGGGTGHYQILRGLKNYDCDLTAIVNVCDSGGHSGKLRDEFGVLPPGDLRQCLVALANDEKAGDLRDIFDSRLERNGRASPSLGNLIIGVLEQKYGRAEAIRRAGNLLGIKGRVLPVSLDDFNIFARLTDDTLLNRQVEVSYKESKCRIKEVFAVPTPYIYKEAAEAIRQATKVVICSGDLYGSIIPNFLVKGIREAIRECDIRVYVCNLVTKQGNYDFKASDFVKEIETYLKLPLTHIVINTKRPSKKAERKYLSEKQKFVEDDLTKSKIRAKVIGAELLEEYLSERKTILRHDPIKTARIIMELL
ncbi:MAG: YvcK family protein [Candidatus Pacearchaeota archaeon]